MDDIQCLGLIQNYCEILYSTYVNDTNKDESLKVHDEITDDEGRLIAPV
jgi:hypothetical protein